MHVFELQSDFTERYEELTTTSRKRRQFEGLEAFPGGPRTVWGDERIAAVWEPVEMKTFAFTESGRRLKNPRRPGDFTRYRHVPIFNGRACAALADFLDSSAGELLPLKMRGRDIAAFHCTRIIDALDHDCPAAKTMEPSHPNFGEYLLSCEGWRFVSDRVGNCHIFRLPQEPTMLFVSDAFVSKGATAK